MAYKNEAEREHGRKQLEELARAWAVMTEAQKRRVYAAFCTSVILSAPMVVHVAPDPDDLQAG